ncbi:MAG: nitroreductase family protein [Nitrospirota bacterium]|nr:nitroreductase family protein [Nitrospirota bacterium]
MDILDIIRQRRSVRDFIEREVPTEVVEEMIEAIRWTPSAGNLQSRRFYFIQNAAVRRSLAKAALDQRFIAQAPLVIVACLDRTISVRYGDRGVNLYAIQDTSAAVMNLMLLAQARGLGTCWVGAFNEFDVIETLDLPDNLRPIAIVPVGYPGKVPPGAQKRLPRESVALFV